MGLTSSLPRTRFRKIFLLSKEIGVGAVSFESEFIFQKAVDEEPIRFDMSVPMSGLVTAELMISVLCKKLRI